MQPKFNLWLEVDGQVVLSDWRVRLLEAIEASGSISAAAEELDLQYRRAWEKVREMERGLGVRLVDTAVGGRGGGGAKLTPAGRRVIEQFHKFSAGFEGEVERRFRAAFGKG